MDTNSLTLKAHKILALSGSIERALSLDIACICRDFDDENKYLLEVLSYLNELKTEIRCFQQDCDGRIFIRKPEDSGIEWHCLMCGVSGIIHNWQEIW